MKKDKDNNLVSIFVKNEDLSIYKGWCWPGDSSWIDYLNEGAQKFWSSLYGYDKFKGTNNLFHIWNDMNEPSVFNGIEGTLPKTKKHLLSDQTEVLHRDVHNFYGLMMTRATYNGMA